MLLDPAGFPEVTTDAVVDFGFPEAPSLVDVTAGAIVGSGFVGLLFSVVGFEGLGCTWLLPFAFDVLTGAEEDSGLEVAEPEGFWLTSEAVGLTGASSPFSLLAPWLPLAGVGLLFGAVGF